MGNECGDPPAKRGSQLQKSSLKSSVMAPSSKPSSLLHSSRVSGGPSGISKRKRVKFADSARISEVSGRQDAPALQTETLHSPRGDAKTSEYKSFKRLWEETDHKRHSSKLPEHDNYPKTIEENGYVEELNNSITCKYDMNRSVLPVQKVTPIAQRSPIPTAKVSQNCALNFGNKYKDNMCSPSLPMQRVSPIGKRAFVLPEKVSRSCGLEYTYGGIFSEKRNTLLKLAVEASSRKVDEVLLNKSDLISEFLQRLGIPRNSVNLDELPKSGQKILRGKYHSLASSKTDGYTMELCETVGSNIVPTSGKENLEKGFPCQLSDELSNLLPECVQLEYFPTRLALETGHKSQGRQFDEQGYAHQLVKKKSAYFEDFRVEFGRRKSDCQTVNHMLSERRQFNEEENAHQLATNKSTIFNDLGIEFGCRKYDKKSVSRMVSNVEFITLPRDSAGIQDSPTSHALITDLRCKRRHLYAENEPASTTFLTTDNMLSKADDLITLPRDYAEIQVSPSTHAVQTSSRGKSSHSRFVLGGISDLHLQNNSTCTRELSTVFDYSRYGFDTMNYMQSKFDHLIPDNLACQRGFREQSISPDSTSLKIYSAHSPNLHPGPVGEHCSLPFQEWDDNINPELSVESHSELPEGIDVLPLTLYFPPDLLDQIDDCRFINACERRNIPSSPSITNCETLMQHRSPIRTPSSGFGLQRKYLPIDFGGKHCASSHADLEFDEQKIYSSLDCITMSNRYDGSKDGKSLIEIPSHFPSDTCSFTNFSLSDLRFFCG